jgi:hypothetical protein
MNMAGHQAVIAGRAGQYDDHAFFRRSAGACCIKGVVVGIDGQHG